MKSHLKKTLGLLGALIVQKSFEEEEREFQLQEKEKEYQLQRDLFRLVEERKQEKLRLAEEIEAKRESVPMKAKKPPPFSGIPFKAYVRDKHQKAHESNRPNKNLIITLRGDKAEARVYKWHDRHWRFVICDKKRIVLIRRTFVDRKRCFAAAKEYIYGRAITPLPVKLETRYDPGARMIRVCIDRYAYIYQPLDTFYDYKAHEIEMRSQTGGDDFNFVYWYTKGVNDAMDDTCEWDIKFNRNLEL